MRVTLTLDNGPTEITPNVLNVLRQREVSALFFALGQQLAVPKLRKHSERAFAEGHRLGNHTFSHTTPFGELDDQRVAIGEVAATQQLLGALAGEEWLFRPNGGGGHRDHRLLNPLVVDHLVRENYTLALWTSVPRDWEQPDDWVETALAECAVEPWSVVVLHDVDTGAMAHLDRFLARLIEAGAEFSTDLPSAVTPLKRGLRTGDLAPLTAH